MFAALKEHWPEYCIEAFGVGVALSIACLGGVLLLHPESPVVSVVRGSLPRRLLLGLLAGCTAMLLGYSPWGKQSGAHFNPTVTLTFYRLKRVPLVDAVWYMLAQLLGALGGIALMSLTLGTWLSDPNIHFVTTRPAPDENWLTWLIEFGMTFILMGVILHVSTSKRRRWTSFCVGLILATNVGAIAPWFGTSLSPWRTVAPAVAAQVWQGVWIYCTAGPAGMLLAATLFEKRRGLNSVFCAKLHHDNNRRCIFCEAAAKQRMRVGACNPGTATASNAESIAIVPCSSPTALGKTKA